jgi:hypothetical protein
MKKKLIALTLAVALTTGATAGCNTAWWSALTNNPVATAQAFEQSVQAVLNIAEATWSGIALFLPSATLATAQPLYNKAVIAVNAALTALNDAIQAAAAVQGPAPNFTALMQDVSNAVTQLQTVIAQFQSSSSSTPAGTASLTTSPPPGLTELNNAVAVMHRVGGVK